MSDSEPTHPEHPRPSSPCIQRRRGIALGIGILAVLLLSLLATATSLRREPPRVDGLTFSDWVARLPTRDIELPGFSWRRHSFDLFSPDQFNEFRMQASRALRELVTPPDLRRLCEDLAARDDSKYQQWLRSLPERGILRRALPFPAQERRIRALAALRLLGPAAAPIQSQLQDLARQTSLEAHRLGTPRRPGTSSAS